MLSSERFAQSSTSERMSYAIDRGYSFRPCHLRGGRRGGDADRSVRPADTASDAWRRAAFVVGRALSGGRARVVCELLSGRVVHFHAERPRLGGNGVFARNVPAGHFRSCDSTYVAECFPRHPRASYSARPRITAISSARNFPIGQSRKRKRVQSSISERAILCN